MLAFLMNGPDESRFVDFENLGMAVEFLAAVAVLWFVVALAEEGFDGEAPREARAWSLGLPKGDSPAWLVWGLRQDAATANPDWQDLRAGA